MEIYEVMGRNSQLDEDMDYGPVKSDEFGFYLKQESAAKTMEEEIQKKMEYFKEYGGEIVLEKEVHDWATYYNILEDGEVVYYFWIAKIEVIED